MRYACERAETTYAKQARVISFTASSIRDAVYATEGSDAELHSQQATELHSKEICIQILHLRAAEFESTHFIWKTNALPLYYARLVSPKAYATT